ncbi:MAG: carbohydrate ABC transporter permease [Alphaproteobacteria bacterium]
MEPRSLASQGLVYLAAFVVFVLSAGPVFLSLLGAVLPDQSIFSFPPDWFARGVTLDNFRFIFLGEIPASYEVKGAIRSMISDAARQLPDGMVNSTLVALGAMAINILVGTPAAYAFARMRFRGKTITLMAIVLSPLVPAVALATPIYMTIEWLGLLGTKTALVLVHTVMTIPFTVLILSVFFRRIPMELEDAAQLDGCTRFQVFTRIVLPLSIPSIFATGLFAFMLSYSEFLFALILGGNAENRALSVVLAALARNTDVSWGLLNSGIFLSVLPSLVLVVVVWKLVVEGIIVRSVQR